MGITQQRGGDLVVDSTKLSNAMLNMDELKNMFRSTGGGAADGIAVKIKALTASMLSTDGFFKMKTDSFQRALDRNTQDQARVNARATQVETDLTKKYSALDAKISSLNALNAYVSQQVTTWNKSGG